VRIAHVSHHFLPRHRAGVEVYTDRICRELQRRGHDVCVITTDDDGARRPFSIREAVQDGLSVWSIAHPRVARTPDDSLGRDEVLDSFDEIVKRVGPEVVHFQHLMYIGLEAAARTRAHGIPSLMTLHEYWLLCARGGQMRRADGEICASAEVEQCARCLGGFRFGRTETEARIASWCARVRRWTGFDPFPLLKGLAQKRGGSRSAPVEPSAATAATAEMAVWLRRRMERVEALQSQIDRFHCPSRFLRDRFIAAGWPAHRLVYSPNGTGPLPTAPRAAADPHQPLRVGFMGAIVPQKGADVLVRAHRELDRGMATLQLWGNDKADPGYAAGVRDQCVPAEAWMRREFPGGRAAEALAQVDVLVVPSVWYENAPVVISEAFACGVPVVASRLGGMAEMVEDGVSGRLFEAGSSVDLARVLRELAGNRQELARLAAGTSQPRTVSDDAAALERIYGELSAG